MICKSSLRENPQTVTPSLTVYHIMTLLTLRQHSELCILQLLKYVKPHLTITTALPLFTSTFIGGLTSRTLRFISPDDVRRFVTSPERNTSCHKLFTVSMTNSFRRRSKGRVSDYSAFSKLPVPCSHERVKTLKKSRGRIV